MMGRMAALMQAGDANTSDFGRGPLWARVLADASGDEAKIEACCEYCPETFSLSRIAPVYKSDGSIRKFAHLHPAAALRWNRLGERLLPHFNVVARRFEGTCFSNTRQHRLAHIAKKGLFEITWSDFIAAHWQLLSHGPCLAILDLRNYFPSVTPDIIQRLLPSFVTDHSLVDGIAEFVADCRVGLPQGSATSQMVAQVLLSHVDERMLRYGFPYKRYVDDMRLAASGEFDLGRDLSFTREIIDDAGFTLNSDKTFCHGRRRSRCVPLLGGCPGHVNVEDYENDDAGFAFEPEPDSFPYAQRSYGRDMHEATKASPKERFDAVSLFEDHVGPTHAHTSDAVERYVIRNVSKQNYAGFRDTEQALSEKRVGMERLYAKCIRPQTALAVGSAILRSEKIDAADQHRAFFYLEAAIEDHECAATAIGELTREFEAGLPAHLELEFCAMAKENSHHYAAVLPVVRKGLEDCWPDTAAARVGALTSMAKAERNRILSVAGKISPAAEAACRLVRNCSA